MNGGLEVIFKRAIFAPFHVWSDTHTRVFRPNSVPD